MEFSFDVRGVVPNVITRVLSRGILLRHESTTKKRNERSQQLAAIVNKLGTASAKAQGLRAAVTTYQKLQASSHTLYLLRDDKDQPAVIGLLKVGRKKLFLLDSQGVQREVEPLCVLDFYVHETKQRAGHGKCLFQTMLKIEGVSAAELAIDRPSIKFLSFLKKHYMLHSYIKQGNNFVVFSQFFQKISSSSHSVTKTWTPQSVGDKRDTLGITGMTIQPISLEEEDDGCTTSLDHRLNTQPLSSSLPDQTGSVQPHNDVKTPTTKQHHSVNNSNDCLTIDSPTNKLQSPQALPDKNHLNINWSPDTVLLRSRQHTRHTSCDIITGVPLMTSISKSQPLCEAENSNKKLSPAAPLLTMRDKRRLRGASRLGFGGGAYSSSRFQTPRSYHLAGQLSSTAELLQSRIIDSASSRHSLIPVHPSSHTLIPPSDSKLTSLEPKHA